MGGSWLVACGLACGVAFSCGGATQCETHRDCENAQERSDLGRCGPSDYACIDGTCEASCAGECSVARDDTNPCKGGRLCTQSAAKPDEAICTSRPIACSSVADCPVYRPGTGEWSCREGTCEFPGFQYRSQ